MEQELAKEKIVQRAPNARDAELVSAWEDAGKKTLKDAANAFIATSAWQVEMMKIGNYFKPTHSYDTIFLELQKLKILRNCRQSSWPKAYRKTSVLGVV